MAQSFASLEQVKAPAGTGPGAKFKVSLPRQRKGKTVQRTVELWHGSGNVPVVQTRAVKTVGEKRAEHRPSARAARGELAIDSITAAANGIVDWEGDEPMPFEACEQDAGWRAGPVGGSASQVLLGAVPSWFR